MLCLLYMVIIYIFVLVEPFKEKIFGWLELGLSYEKIVKHLGFGSKSALYSFVKYRKGLPVR